MIHIFTEPDRYYLFSSTQITDLDRALKSQDSRAWRPMDDQEVRWEEIKVSSAVPGRPVIVAIDPGSIEFIESLLDITHQLEREDAQNLVLSLVDPAKRLKMLKAGKPGMEEISAVKTSRSQRILASVRASGKKYWRIALPVVGLCIASCLGGYLLGHAPAQPTTVSIKPVQPTTPATKPVAPPPKEPFTDILISWQKVNNVNPFQAALASTHAFPTRKESIERFALAALKYSLALPAETRDLSRPGILKSTMGALGQPAKFARIPAEIRELAGQVLCDEPPDSQLLPPERNSLREALHHECKSNGVTEASIDAAAAAVQKLPAPRPAVKNTPKPQGGK